MATRIRIGTSVLLAANLGCSTVQAATPLADQPLFSTSTAPGNLALVLSVEFPTAVSVAHTNRTYAATNEYLGYFDPNKCYTYRYTDGTSTDNYFQPAALATAHACNGQWSGNFLNWATMQTIDPFRWVAHRRLPGSSTKGSTTRANAPFSKRPTRRARAARSTFRTPSSRETCWPAPHRCPPMPAL